MYSFFNNLFSWGVKCSLLLVLLTYLVSCQSGTEETSLASQKKVPKEVDFNLHVKPILSDRCFACHGPDENHREAGLRLDTEEGAMSALEEGEGHAIVPGNVKKSVVYQRIRSDDPEMVMPPPASNLVLTEYEKEVLEKWIKQGAEWKAHWSFIPPEKAELPEVDEEEWGRNPIDRFVLARLEDEGLQPSPEASKEKLLRRVTFDLTGLPPSPEEINAFLQDDSPEAYEKVVDRLLASSHYGERMAPSWLDISRYADSHGYQDDRPRTMWPWRDWVVKAFNENLPYDQFITWQLAGDLLPNATYEQKLATGFNRNHAITQEGGVIAEEYLTEYASDRTNTFSSTFLGLTVECARCHDHKYDPISQKDYYQLFAFFNNVPEQGQIDYLNQAPEPAMRVQNAELEAKKAYVDSTIQVLESRLRDLEQHPDAGFQKWLANVSDNPSIDIETDQEAHFKLNVLENEEFLSSDGTIPARMNVALPKKIPLPEHVAGKEGKGLQFNGSNFLMLGDIADFDYHDHFSFGGWIQHTNAHTLRAGIFSRRNGEIQRQGYDMTLTEDNRLSLRLIHHFDQQKYLEVTTQAKIPAKQWTHVFATYDGSGKAEGVQLYINGRAQAVTAPHDNLGRQSILNGNEFLVGHWNSRDRATDTYGFEGGTIDEVRIYHRMLSPLEVQALAEVPTSTSKEALYRHYLTKASSEFQQLNQKLDKLRPLDVTIPDVMIMAEREERKQAYVLARGSYDAPTDPVSPGTPKALLAFDERFPQNRLGLAQWLVDKDNPLTARVAVNRFWQLYFGKGLVRTPEDFGNQGDLPTHPKLLDWLAVEFRESGWDVKGMQKLIVMSATYRQASEITPKKHKKDSENLLLARGPNVRLTAEMFRDNALAVSGLLVDSLGGKWVKPYQPDDIWKAMANQIGENKYRPSKGQGLYRRSLYTYWKRTIPPPTMVMFDAPERTICAVKRQSTSTPLQSLALLNDPQIVEAARKLAEVMLKKGDETLKEQIAYGFQAMTSRMPKEEELEILMALYEEKQAYFQSKPEEAQKLLHVGDSPCDPDLEPAQVAALTVVANTLFNLDEAKFRS
ncbi:MAG: DUF1553 domain-containing protein [Cyclobacteriaceae bacterium]